MPRPMTLPEREEFLAAAHVAVLSVAAGDSRGPVSAPIWYRFEPGGPVQFISLPGSRKVELIGRTGRASLCVQTEDLPYRYVTVEGPVTPAGTPGDDWRRELNRRYLGPDLGDHVFEATKDFLAGQVLFELAPQRWTSNDFSEDFPSDG